MTGPVHPTRPLDELVIEWEWGEEMSWARGGGNRGWPDRLDCVG